MFYPLTTVTFTHIYPIYPSEHEKKDTTFSETSVSYLEILLEKDFYCNLTTKLYVKRDYFNFLHRQPHLFM